MISSWRSVGRILPVHHISFCPKPCWSAINSRTGPSMKLPIQTPYGWGVEASPKMEISLDTMNVNSSFMCIWTCLPSDGPLEELQHQNTTWNTLIAFSTTNFEGYIFTVYPSLIINISQAITGLVSLEDKSLICTCLARDNFLFCLLIKQLIFVK